MVAENKISPRQLRRMLFIEMFGAGALSVPALACYNGQSGGVAVLFYGIFLIIATVVFYILSEKIQEQFSENAKSYAEILPKSIQSIYFIRFAINVAALFYFFGETIQTVYMPKSSFLFILFPAALLLWYTLNTNLQKRARFLELIFPWIFVSYGIAVFLSFVGIETSIQPGTIKEVWRDIFSDTAIQSLRNGYILFVCGSPIEFLLFLKPAAKTKQKTKRSIITAAFGVFFCNVLLIFLAVRTLGKTLTTQSAWPVIKMMQLIRMSGGFLERFDILPAIVWVLCMMAVISGYLYYGKKMLEQLLLKKSKEPIVKKTTAKKSIMKESIMKQPIATGTSILCFLLLACLVEKQPYLWNFYLKYKIFVDVPLALLLPVFVYIAGRKNTKNKKLGKSTETEDKIKKKEPILYLFTILLVLGSSFSLTGCRHLTDIEEKSYVLSLYVDRLSGEENGYAFQVARADLNKMEERDEEIPCQITKIKAKTLKELEEKYLRIIPGEMEWNHIYTIFFSLEMTENKEACMRLLEEWDGDWQKSPNVFLVASSPPPDKLYKVKNIPKGAAGQEVSLLIKQSKKQQKIKSDPQNDTEKICETPIDYLRHTEQFPGKSILHQIVIEDGKIVLIDKK